MTTETIYCSPEAARRIFITKQHLSGRDLEGSFDRQVVDLMRDVGYIQWDPVTVVAPSHTLSLWSRIGKYDPGELDDLMWSQKKAFLHWTPIAWLVLMEDYPLYYSLMKRYPDSLGNSWRSSIEPARRFLATHSELRKQVLDKLRDGPAEIGQFRGYGKRRKSNDGWSTGNEVSTLLYHLHMAGEVMVSGRVGNQNQWSRSEDFLPEFAQRNEIPEDELERRTVIRSLRGLGIAPAFDINRYFIRGRYTNLNGAIRKLEEDGQISRVEIDGERKGKPHYVLNEDVKLLEGMDKPDSMDNLNLVSPFDNLITIRERTKRMFNFDYILEQFVPKSRRKFGTYVMPILMGDHLVGRVDAKLEKTSGILNINSVHAEKGFEGRMDIPEKLKERVEELGSFLGAEKIAYGKQAPTGWKRILS